MEFRTLHDSQEIQHMTVAIDSMLFAARRTLGYAETLLKGIEPATAARFPRFGSAVITTNHPVFVYGHLAIYPKRMLELVGKDPSAVTPPETYVRLFSAGVECVDDVDGKSYPKFDEVTRNFFEWSKIAMESLGGVRDEVLAQENPNEKSRAAFPTVGGVLLFLTNNHPMMHLGQVSAWRRCYGLPAAM